MGRKRKHETVRAAIYFVLDCVAGGCTAGEGIAALEKEGYKLDSLIPTDQKLTVFQLAERITTALDADPEAAAYFATLGKACKQVVDVAHGRVKELKS